MNGQEGCYIYIIATIRDEIACAPIKVGITKTPPSRLASVQTGSPCKVDIACVLWANRSSIKVMENMFHEMHADCALEGEWFDIRPLPAAESLARIYRWFVNSAQERGLPDDAVWHCVNESGLYALEKKCEAERYMSAWEAAS